MPLVSTLRGGTRRRNGASSEWCVFVDIKSLPARRTLAKSSSTRLALAAVRDERRGDFIVRITTMRKAKPRKRQVLPDPVRGC